MEGGIGREGRRPRTGALCLGLEEPSGRRGVCISSSEMGGVGLYCVRMRGAEGPACCNSMAVSLVDASQQCNAWSGRWFGGIGGPASIAEWERREGEVAIRAVSRGRKGGSRGNHTYKQPRRGMMMRVSAEGARRRGRGADTCQSTGWVGGWLGSFWMGRSEGACIES